MVPLACLHVRCTPMGVRRIVACRQANEPEVALLMDDRLVIGNRQQARQLAGMRGGACREAFNFSRMGGQFDSVRSSACTMHPRGGACVQVS